MILDNKENLDNYNLCEKRLSITIIKELNDQIKVKYPNSEELQINTDLCNTVFEFL